ncbi:carbohydrate ABC transporter permease [Pseudobacteriovorax antillogorgiicola]|uniref:Carbohydrate ABC transporter membrane protein 1, CUT1 family n=1 Tax=Pseudobacteriovorax antillogorgiicola TaxID=1513793 RepID=A0A1Y6CME0_9BACT|nr:sugar ABC transporter permease [Pseudobacteriovorax antillogorgiicola]TCS47627.1 carbohydrate ABC transporter membrane protein 1 (CUT1 family) [Pseudobacteriovorax antillogorgiicola]SMF59992.1 carbohydrate ABC transporter membrane protein 1, CUT1 family [Pseudobacteriovorax antillogorgiicola]
MSSEKQSNQKAWFLVAPVFLMLAFTTIIPLMTVVNYSVQDILGPSQRVFVGWEWFIDVIHSEELHGAFGRQLLFSLVSLMIEIPLGIFIARFLPTKGAGVSISLVILAMPLLIPYNVVGTIWQILARSDIGLLGATIQHLGIDFNYAANPFDAWLTLMLLEVWHWLPLVILLVYSGLRSIPHSYYQAAYIDRATDWDIFRFIELPKLKNVLVIALMLRFMDSFMIYTEPFVLTGGGPGNTTTFLSQYLTRLAVGQFDLGIASAFSLIYFLIILLVCFIFYNLIMNSPDEHKKDANPH